MSADDQQMHVSFAHTEARCDETEEFPNELLSMIAVFKRHKLSPMAAVQLTACLFGSNAPMSQTSDSSNYFQVSVEVIGSGKLLIRQLDVDKRMTLGALRAAVVQKLHGRRSLPDVAQLRLFLGHEGREFRWIE